MCIYIHIYIFIIVSCNRPVITDRFNYAIQMGMNNGGGCIQSVCPLAHETRRFYSVSSLHLFFFNFTLSAARFHFIKFCVYVCVCVSADRISLLVSLARCAIRRVTIPTNRSERGAMFSSRILLIKCFSRHLQVSIVQGRAASDRSCG